MRIFPLCAGLFQATAALSLIGAFVTAVERKGSPSQNASRRFLGTDHPQPCRQSVKWFSSYCCDCECGVMQCFRNCVQKWTDYGVRQMSVSSPGHTERGSRSCCISQNSSWVRSAAPRSALGVATTLKINSAKLSALGVARPLPFCAFFSRFFLVFTLEVSETQRMQFNLMNTVLHTS